MVTHAPGDGSTAEGLEEKSWEFGVGEAFVKGLQAREGFKGERDCLASARSALGTIPLFHTLYTSLQLGRPSADLSFSPADQPSVCLPCHVCRVPGGLVGDQLLSLLACLIRTSGAVCTCGVC